MEVKSLFLAIFCLYAAITARPIDPENTVIAYFGGMNQVPPMINGNYANDTEMMIYKGDPLSLTCSAKYPVTWSSPVRIFFLFSNLCQFSSFC